MSSTDEAMEKQKSTFAYLFDNLTKLQINNSMIETDWNFETLCWWQNHHHQATFPNRQTTATARLQSCADELPWELWSSVAIFLTFFFLNDWAGFYCLAFRKFKLHTGTLIFPLLFFCSMAAFRKTVLQNKTISPSDLLCGLFLKRIYIIMIVSFVTH